MKHSVFTKIICFTTLSVFWALLLLISTTYSAAAASATTNIQSSVVKALPWGDGYGETPGSTRTGDSGYHGYGRGDCYGYGRHGRGDCYRHCRPSRDKYGRWDRCGSNTEEKETVEGGYGGSGGVGVIHAAVPGSTCDWYSSHRLVPPYCKQYLDPDSGWDEYTNKEHLGTIKIG